jgi:hypothetical protein
LSEASYLGTLLLFELFYVEIRVPSTKYWLGTRRRRGAANLKVAFCLAAGQQTSMASTYKSFFGP